MLVKSTKPEEIPVLLTWVNLTLSSLKPKLILVKLPVKVQWILLPSTLEEPKLPPNKVKLLIDKLCSIPLKVKELLKLLDSTLKSLNIDKFITFSLPSEISLLLLSVVILNSLKLRLP